MCSLRRHRARGSLARDRRDSARSSGRARTGPRGFSPAPWQPSPSEPLPTRPFDKPGRRSGARGDWLACRVTSRARTPGHVTTGGARRRVTAPGQLTGGSGHCGRRATRRRSCGTREMSRVPVPQIQHFTERAAAFGELWDVCPSSAPRTAPRRRCPRC